MKSIDELDLKLAKYKIDKCKLTIDGYGEFEVNPFYITSWIMEKDYDNYSFPYLELFMGLPINIFRALKKKNTKNYCYLRIMYAYFDVNDVAYENMTPNEKLYMAKNFFIYGMEGTPQLAEDAEEFIEESLQITDSPGDLNHMVSTYLLLYDEDKLNKVTTIFNEIITDCTLTDAVTRVLNNAKFKKVLMTPADNGKLYHEFMLLPVRTDEQLLHICNDYHMHNTGTRIFYDFEYTYIVSKSMECDAWRPGEYKKTYVIYDPPILSRRTQGCCEDGDTRSNYCTMDNFALANPSYMEEQVYGLSYTHLDMKTGEITTVKPDAKKISDKKPSPSRMIYNNYGEAGTSQQMGINQENSTAVWEVIIDSFLIDFLTPNKAFEFFFNSTKLAKYNGAYKIAKFTTVFNKMDSEWYTTSTKAMFRGKRTT